MRKLHPLYLFMILSFLSSCGKPTDEEIETRRLGAPAKKSEAKKDDWNNPEVRDRLMNEHLNELKIHEDKNAKFGVYVPTSFDDALKELDYMLPPEAKQDIKNCNLEDMINYHFGFGMWIRNNWCLWSGGPLVEDMKRRGFTEPDDMSGAIFDSYWLKMHGKPLNTEAQAEEYQEYWDHVHGIRKEP